MWDQDEHCSQLNLRCLPKCNFQGYSSEIAVNCSESLLHLTLDVVALILVTKDTIEGCNFKNQHSKVSSVTEVQVTISTASRKRHL